MPAFCIFGVFATASTPGCDLGPDRVGILVEIRQTTCVGCWHIACSDSHHPRLPSLLAASPHHKDLPMSKKSAPSPFASIDTAKLDQVSGGASRVTARSGSSNDQLTTMLTGITDSIKNLAASKSQGGMDPMMMMMMMMMMGGGGGGGGGGAPMQAAAPQAPVINITTDVKRRW
jgi:hypothetical protein